MGAGDDDERCPRADVARLAAELVATSCAANSFQRLKLSAGAILALEHALPSRHELEATIDSAVKRAHDEECELVERRHIFPELPFHEATLCFQEQLVRDVLAREEWNIAAAARTLGISRVHVYTLMRTFQIQIRRSRKS